MKRLLIFSSGVLTGLGMAVLLLVLNFDIVPSPVPPPASTISVETVDIAMADAITEDVGNMLLQNPHYYPLRALQGTASNTEYYFRLNGTCAQAAELIADLTEVIRRHTNAPVRCTDPA